ncbi:MAG TPA: hypothetical protein VMS96_10675, partial [Terriglobales bacterium]|nr:hypothetical protein [Terriglobales bacterium]
QKTWEERGLRVRDLVAPDPLFVASRADSLERAVVSLLGHVERCLEYSTEKTATLRASRLAAMAQVDISWPGSAQELEAAGERHDEDTAFENGYSFTACRDLIRIHGGEVTLTTFKEGPARMEIEIPLAALELTGGAALPRGAAKATAPLTALVLEPEPEARQLLVSSLSDLGHRSVTAASAEEAAELAKRLHFNVFFCTSVLPGEGWPACFESSRADVPSFVLLTRGHDPALAAVLPAGQIRALAKPVRPDELHRLIAELPPRAAGPGR